MMSRSSYKRLLDNDPDLEQRSPGPLLESNSQLAQEHARTSVTSRTRPAIPTQPEPQLSNPRRRKPVASAAVGTTGVFQATRPSGSAPIIPRQGALSAAIAASRTDGKGPRRTTRTTQKLTFLTDELNVDRFEVVGDDDTVRPMIALRDKLPRVTAYCTAGSYKMDALFEFLMSRREINSTAPKRFDEAIYTPFSSTGDPIDALVSGRPPEIISEAILGPKNLSHGQLGRAYIRVPKDNNTDLQLSLGAPVMSTSAPESFRSPPPTPSRVIGAKHDGVKIGTSEPGSGSTTPQILPAIKPVRRHSLDSELQSSNIEVSRFASASNQFGSDEYLDNAGSGTHRHLRFNESVKIGTFETPGETEEPDESRVLQAALGSPTTQQ
ncbi:hypothetical protein BJ742DRAFT_275750 [Cladochytrium replicatum]|nr:hypothetical protein BJ742DRAFT_275750 [Cladochytrium replicatum]